MLLTFLTELYISNLCQLYTQWITLPTITDKAIWKHLNFLPVTYILHHNNAATNTTLTMRVLEKNNKLTVLNSPFDLALYDDFLFPKTKKTERDTTVSKEEYNSEDDSIKLDLKLLWKVYYLVMSVYSINFPRRLFWSGAYW